jgi:hypothetical protein
MTASDLLIVPAAADELGGFSEGERRLLLGAAIQIAREPSIGRPTPATDVGQAQSLLLRYEVRERYAVTYVVIPEAAPVVLSFCEIGTRGPGECIDEAIARWEAIPERDQRSHVLGELIKNAAEPLRISSSPSIDTEPNVSKLRALRSQNRRQRPTLPPG